MDDWDDLRILRAVASAGTTLGASRNVGISQSTVVRRVAAIEAKLKLKLFDKRPSGYVSTDDLNALLPVIDQIASNVDQLSAIAASRRRTISGTVRFSAPEIITSYVLPPVLRDFRKLYPSVRLELITTDQAVDLASGVADVALRGDGAPPEGAGLFGRRLSYDRPVITAHFQLC